MSLFPSLFFFTTLMMVGKYFFGGFSFSVPGGSRLPSTEDCIGGNLELFVPVLHEIAMMFPGEAPSSPISSYSFFNPVDTIEASAESLVIWSKGLMGAILLIGQEHLNRRTEDGKEDGKDPQSSAMHSVPFSAAQKSDGALFTRYSARHATRESDRSTECFLRK